MRHCTQSYFYEFTHQMNFNIINATHRASRRVPTTLMEGCPYIVLDLSAGAGVDGQPSLLVLRLHIRILRRQRVLHLQTGSNSCHLCVPGIGQNFGQLHQEGRLKQTKMVDLDEPRAMAETYPHNRR